MSTREHLSREERALFNPVFMALIACRAVQGHQKQSGPCPMPVAITASVMALQPAVRAMLPSNTNTVLSKWIDENQTVRVFMRTNAPALAAMLRPGVLLAAQTGLLDCNESAALTLRPRVIPAAISGSSDTFIAIQKAVHLLGRWLPTGGSTATVLTLLGVRL